MTENENVLIKREDAHSLLRIIKGEIEACIDNPNYRGQAPKTLIELKDALTEALGIST